MADKLRSIIDTIKRIWSEQSKFNKYLAIAGISVPSYILLREMYYFVYRKYHSLPPGPNGLPIFGMLFSWAVAGSDSRINLGKKYGPILYSEMVGYPMIILSSSKLVKQFFIQKEFLNRRKHESHIKSHQSIWTFGKSQAVPMIDISGESWQKRRKLCQDTLFRVLNNENAGALLNQAMNEEFAPYLNDIIDSNKTWYPKEICSYIAVNTIFSTLFGRNIGRKSQLFEELYMIYDEQMKSTFLDLLVVANVPFFKYVYGAKLDAFINRRDNKILELVKERMASKTEQKIKPFIDYTHEMVVNGELSQDEEIADVFILFLAGMETTANSLDFAIALIAKHQDIQEKIRNELLNVMGNEFNLKMVNKCPLFRAAIHETMRISSVTYVGGEHCSYSDCWVTLDDGTRYKIPKNVTLSPNVDFIHIYGGENENWKRTEGDKMFLENFLVEDDDGGVRFVVNESFIPFGVGRRDCVGRQLAMKEMEYTLGYLLMNYKISLSDEYMNKSILEMRSTTLFTASVDPPIPIVVQKFAV